MYIHLNEVWLLATRRLSVPARYNDCREVAKAFRHWRLKNPENYLLHTCGSIQDSDRHVCTYICTSWRQRHHLPSLSQSSSRQEEKHLRLVETSCNLLTVCTESFTTSVCDSWTCSSGTWLHGGRIALSHSRWVLRGPCLQITARAHPSVRYSLVIIFDTFASFWSPSHIEAGPLALNYTFGPTTRRQ